MKRTLCLLPLLLLFFASCEKFNKLLTFEISNSEKIKIPASGLINSPIISPVPVTMRSEENFKSNNTSANLVKDVRLSKLNLTIVDPSAENFNFLKSIKIYIGTEQNEKILLAFLENVPMDVSSIQLTASNSNLDKYIKASSYSLYTEVALQSNVARELTVTVDSRFKVTADPL